MTTKSKLKAHRRALRGDPKPRKKITLTERTRRLLSVHGWDTAQDVQHRLLMTIPTGQKIPSVQEVEHILARLVKSGRAEASEEWHDATDYMRGSWVKVYRQT